MGAAQVGRDGLGGPARARAGVPAAVGDLLGTVGRLRAGIAQAIGTSNLKAFPVGARRMRVTDEAPSVGVGGVRLDDLSGLGRWSIRDCAVPPDLRPILNRSERPMR